MDENILDDERVFRAVYPPGHPKMFWKKDGSLAPAALYDHKGLSVDRDAKRNSEDVVADMLSRLTGCIVSWKVEECRKEQVSVEYMPSKTNKYHSELHGSLTEITLSTKQRVNLAKIIRKELMVNTEWFE